MFIFYKNLIAYNYIFLTHSNLNQVAIYGNVFCLIIKYNDLTQPGWVIYSCIENRRDDLF